MPLTNALYCRKVSSWNDYNVLSHSRDSSISIYKSSQLLHFFSVNQKFSFGGWDANWALNEAPGFEMCSGDNRNFRQFAIQRLSAVWDNAKVLVSRTKEENDNPCYPACPMRGFEGGRHVPWRVAIMWLVMWYIAGGREEAMTPYKERKWCTKKIDTPSHHVSSGVLWEYGNTDFFFFFFVI